MTRFNDFGGNYMDEKETKKDPTSAIDEAVNGFINGLEKNGAKLSVTDVIRLLELRKQLAQDDVREVRVTWADSDPDPVVINI
jgi:hypothetical protein